MFARLLDGAGPTPSATTDFEGGALTQTEGPLDVALEGDGFLVVKTPEGLRLTRGGALSIDGSARLVDAAGNPVLGDQGEILLPPGDVQINRDGVISVDGTPEATLRVVDIEDPAQLLRGEGLLFATDAELVSAGGVTVHQGYLEESNVEPISSLVEMIEIQRVRVPAKSVGGAGSSPGHHRERVVPPGVTPDPNGPAQARREPTDTEESMDPSLQTAATGMKAQQTRVEVIANNLANVNTTGFKRSMPHFEDLLYQTAQGAQSVEGADADTTEAIQIGRGTRLAAVQRVEIQGALLETGRKLDMAVEGDGFFQVQLPNGSPAYTRDGSFMLSDQGSLVTNAGYTVLPGVSIPPDTTDITISRTGILTATVAGSLDPIEVGRIELARFTNSAGLQAIGENLLVQTQASGDPGLGFPQDDGFGRVIQGALESSNVEIVQEMVEMITAMRA